MVDNDYGDDPMAIMRDNRARRRSEVMRRQGMSPHVDIDGDENIEMSGHAIGTYAPDSPDLRPP